MVGAGVGSCAMTLVATGSAKAAGAQIRVLTARVLIARVVLWVVFMMFSLFAGMAIQRNVTLITGL